MMNDIVQKQARTTYAVICMITLSFIETMHHIIDAAIFLPIDHQLSKQINFSYFAASNFMA